MNVESFISNLELMELPSELKKLLPSVPIMNNEDDTTKPSASIVGDAIMAFTANVKDQSRFDLQNATCLAYLAAQTKFDKFDKTEEFYKFYTEVLANIGFVVQAFNFTKHEVSGSEFAVHKVIIDVMKAYITNDEAALVEASIKALEALSDDDDTFKLFSKTSHKSEASDFIVGIADQAENGDVAFKIGAFKLSSKQNNSRFLWFSFSTTNSNLFKSSQVFTFNETIYSQVRDQIIKKLGSNAKVFIRDLEIKVPSNP